MKTELRNSVLQLARLLQELKGEDTIAVRLEPSVSWASYCIISTCNSVTHMHGILGRLRKELIFEDSELRWNVCALSRQLEYTSWFPIDLGLIVIHLMSYDAREFYELEKLWPVAEILKLSKF